MIYKTRFGFYNHLSVWTTRLIWASVLFMTLINFNKNPQGLSILSVIVITALASVRTEQLISDGASVIFIRKYLFGFLPFRTKFKKEEIEDLSIEGNRNLNNNMIMNILPFGMKFRNRVTFSLRNGSTKTFKTDLFIEELNKFKEHYNKNT